MKLKDVKVTTHQDGSKSYVHTYLPEEEPQDTRNVSVTWYILTGVFSIVAVTLGVLL